MDCALVSSNMNRMNDKFSIAKQAAAEIEISMRKKSFSSDNDRHGKCFHKHWFTSSIPLCKDLQTLFPWSFESMVEHEVKDPRIIKQGKMCLMI